MDAKPLGDEKRRKTARRSCGFAIRRQKKARPISCGFEIRLKRDCLSPAGPFSGLQIRNSYPYSGGLQIRRNRLCLFYTLSLGLIKRQSASLHPAPTN